MAGSGVPPPGIMVPDFPTLCVESPGQLPARSEGRGQADRARAFSESVVAKAPRLILNHYNTNAHRMTAKCHMLVA